MKTPAILPVSCLVLTCLSLVEARELPFEDVVRMSERIVVAKFLGAGSGSATAANGARIVLGIKDPGTGLVFTPWRILVEECLFDLANACEEGEQDVFAPGGT